MYDRLMRLPFLTWVVCVTLVQLFGFIHSVRTNGIDAIQIAMRLSTIVFLLLLAAAVILRCRPTLKASGMEPRISALAGTFLMYAVILFPGRDLSAAAQIIATLLSLVGTAGAIVALAQLGGSFSVMAEGRQLVTTGPYGLVRHPLYLAEEIAMVGLFIQFASIWTALIFAAQITFQLRRIFNEEAVLNASFPEYHKYQRITARLIPGIY